MMHQLILILLFFQYTLLAEENFFLINSATDEIVIEFGPHVNERTTPGSTFKIALSLMGFDAEILKTEKIPTWIFQEGYDDDFESWKAPQTPQSWMKNSCVWYSRLLALELGLEKIQNYLRLLEYGNQDMTGGLTTAWLSSSLKISPKEQVSLLQKIVNGCLLLSEKSIQITKSLLFIEELTGGWKLFGKTALGSLQDQGLKIGWFVGWIEKDKNFFIFAYNIRDQQIITSERIPRVKQLLDKHLMLKNSVMTGFSSFL